MEVNKHRMLSTTLVSVKKQFIKTVPDFAIVIHFNLNKKKLLQNLFISTKIELKYATYIYIYIRRIYILNFLYEYAWLYDWIY